MKGKNNGVRPSARKKNWKKSKESRSNSLPRNATEKSNDSWRKSTVSRRLSGSKRLSDSKSSLLREDVVTNADLNLTNMATTRTVLIDMALTQTDLTVMALTSMELTEMATPVSKSKLIGGSRRSSERGKRPNMPNTRNLPIIRSRTTRILRPLCRTLDPKKSPLLRPPLKAWTRNGLKSKRCF